MRLRLLMLAVLLLLSCGGKVSAEVDFTRDVYTVMRRACFECHGPERQEADLRLDRREDLMESGMVDPGSPDDSELLRRIMLPRGHEEVMPALGDPLNRREIAAIQSWIEAGAVWPQNFEPPPHWAYVRPQRQAPPEVAGDRWPRNAIDRFVLRKLEDEGLRPAPEAAPETLVRRLFLDLIGLPPTPKEVEAFVSDPSEQAYRRLIDDLMRRPQFGERWARHWLDLARYADSHGFQRDNLREVWAYRDWVIRALNDDMPFSQFTIEQLAGDLLPDAGESQRIATGFHRCTPTNVEAGSLPEETRTEQVIDRVNTTAAVWLGSTLECAQCHDHKYDPFTMKDYYRLLAYFNSTEREADRANPESPSSIKFLGPSMPVSDPQKAARREELQQQIAALQKQQAARRKLLEADLDTWAGRLAARISEAPTEHPVELVDFQSQGITDSHEQLDDGAILLVGDDPPATDQYVVTLRPGARRLSALRLDVLTHESLPGMGPGRGDPVRTNFILSEFTVQRDGKPVAVASAKADFSQQNWPVENAIDGNGKTGWAIAPQFGKPHWAMFVLEEPLECDQQTELTVRLDQNFGSSRTIGCFRLQAVTGDLSVESVGAKLAEAANRPADMWSPQDRKLLLEHRGKSDKELSRLQSAADKLRRELATIEPDTTLVMIELDEPRPTRMFQRGDYRTPGEPVEPGTPGMLHPAPEGPPNRLTLARWIVDPANPLTARVAVNRWWAELFGRGIVPTLEDFGVKGDPPSHPELLDHLALELIDNGWSMKETLRTIVSSSTYRQSSAIRPELHERDPDNRLLARGPRFRMDAEMIRDNALAIAGLLSTKQFGPPIRPYQPEGIWNKVGGTSYKYEVSPGEDRHRRGIYVVLKRGAPYPSFVNFDASARLSCVVRRSRTNTPLQALTLLNDPVYVEAAWSLARRTLIERPESDDEERLSHAFQLCTARRPQPAELRVLGQLLERQRDKLANRGGPAASPAVPAPSGVSAQEFEAWFAVASTLLNLHETITKQ